MVRTLARRGAVGVLAALTATAGLMVPAQALPVPVPMDDAGALVGWGVPNDSTAWTVPPALQSTAFTDVAAGPGSTLALTAAGEVLSFSTSSLIRTIPASLTGVRVRQVAAGSSHVGAVTADGRVVVWGTMPPGPSPRDVPAGLSGVRSLAFGQQFAVAAKTDGTLVAWGNDTYGQVSGVAGITDVASVVAGNTHGYALTTNGTVAAWGRNDHGQTTLPAALTIPGNVKAVSGRTGGGLALLADGSLVGWGQFSDSANLIPASLTGKTVVAISANTGVNMAIDDEGDVTVWGPGAAVGGDVRVALSAAPGSLAGSDVAAVSVSSGHAVAILTRVLAVEAPRISGTAQIGQTLTGTPATFSGAPDEVTSTWRADGAAIEGATGSTLTLTAAQAGKQITFTSSATKGSTAPVVASSAPTARVSAAKVASTTTVSTTPGRYGSAGRATVTVTNGAGRPVSGTVTLSGAGATQRANVVGGRATFTLGKALAARAYTVTASYAGSADLHPSSRSARYSVAKGKTKRPAFKATKAPTSKKKGKATVTVATTSGLAAATSKVTVTLKKGKSTKKVNGTLSRGKRSISLPKLAKGTWKVTVTYRGDRNYVTQKSTTYRLKVKK